MNEHQLIITITDRYGAHHGTLEIVGGSRGLLVRTHIPPGEGWLCFERTQIRTLRDYLTATLEDTKP